MHAEQLAKELHAGQMYGNKDYFEAHLKVVAWSVAGAEINLQKQLDEDFKWIVHAVAFLHDTIEDCGVSGEWLRERLSQTPYSQNEYDNINAIVTAVEALTKRSGEEYDTYIQRVKQNKYAAFVKYFDSEANMYACIADGNSKRAEKYLKNMCELYEFVKGEASR